ncbi:MAG: hypothetical protein R3D00_22865 [Bacteroidia bacterium]
MVGRAELIFIILVVAFLFYPYFNRRAVRKSRRKWFWSNMKMPRFRRKSQEPPNAIPVEYEEME